MWWLLKSSLCCSQGYADKPTYHRRISIAGILTFSCALFVIFLFLTVCVFMHVRWICALLQICRHTFYHLISQCSLYYSILYIFKNSSRSSSKTSNFSAEHTRTEYIFTVEVIFTLAPVRSLFTISSVASPLRRGLCESAWHSSRRLGARLPASNSPPLSILSWLGC